jgi:four helix bundle protein
MMKRPHYNLLAWQKSVELVTVIYSATMHFPTDERFGLTNQIRRAAVSVPSNIAEGAARTSKKEFLQFLNIAKGSLSEVDTQLYISLKLGYIQGDNPAFALSNQVAELLYGFIRKIES